MDDEVRRLRKEIGERAKRAREHLPDDRRMLQQFSAMLSVADSLLSQMESGARPFPADLLYRVAELTGTHPQDLFPNRSTEREAPSTFRAAIDYLQQAERLGVEHLSADRDSAMFRLIPFLKEMYSGDVMITASSLKGVQQDSNHEFVRTLLLQRANRPKIRVRAIMTHPKFGYMREFLENRIKGSIVSEIFQGIRWAISNLKISSDEIRLVKASPTCFSIFLQDSRGDGIGLINPYPMMKQAFLSLSLIVRTVDPRDASGRAQSIFQSYVNANFQAPWDDRSGMITVSLEEALKECQDEEDELLTREAESFMRFLDDRGRERRGPDAVEAAIPAAKTRRRVNHREDAPAKM